MHIREAIGQNKIKFAKINEKGEFVLKKSHNYYYQIQGQLHISNKDNCYFICWTPIDMEVEIIYKDDSFWDNEMSNKLEEFYFNYFLNVIIKERIINKG